MHNPEVDDTFFVLILGSSLESEGREFLTLNEVFPTNGFMRRVASAHRLRARGQVVESDAGYGLTDLGWQHFRSLMADIARATFN